MTGPQPNRYFPGSAAFEPCFYGRRAQLRAVWTFPWVWVCGQRRMGKTSLLHRIEKEVAKRGGLPLILSMVHCGEKPDGKDFFSGLLLGNKRLLERRPNKSKELLQKDFNRLPAADRFYKLYETLRDEGSEVAFFVDEAELLCVVEQRDPGFLGRLHALFQDAPGFRFVVSTTQLLSKLYQAGRGADQFLYQFQWTPLPGLADDEAAELLQCRNHAPWKPPLTGEVVDEVVGWSGGHPLILQHVGSLMSDDAESRGDDVVAVEHARRCVRALKQSEPLNLIFLDDYKKLTAEQQAVLRACCDSQNGLDVGGLTRASGLDAPVVKKAVTFLANYGYVAVDGEDAVRLRFRFYRDFLPGASTGTDASTEDVGRIPRASQPVEWIAQRSESGGVPQILHVLKTGSKGSGGLSDKQPVVGNEIERLVATLDRRPPDEVTIERLGDALARAVLTAGLDEALDRSRDLPLVVYFDNTLSHVPWELIRVKGRYLCEAPGLSRRYLNPPGAGPKWLETRPDGRKLSLLLVTDPTGNLPAALKEGQDLVNLFTGDSLVEITPVFQKDATKARLLEEFRSGRHDAVHYAGHAYFHSGHPGDAGLVCHGREVLTGSEIGGVRKLPALVVFNACQSGRIRSDLRRMEVPEPETSASVQERVGAVEALLRGGIANFVGTYWPVGDVDAETFAAVFYPELSKGGTIGVALDRARSVLRRNGSLDWLNYHHYGDYDFALKKAPHADPTTRREPTTP